MKSDKTMRALQLQGIGQFVEVLSPMPVPKPNELLVRTVAATICTSDLNDIAHNPFNIRLPRVLGHEGTGTVAAIGESVGDFHVGDRIAAHPVIPCRVCEACGRGLGHLCSNLGHLGLDRNGTFAEYFCIPADRARQVPPSMEPCSGALLEPVAVCLEALDRGRLRQGETLLVVGDGPFGILIARMALACEPRRIILVGRHDFRLQQVRDAITINQRRSADVLAAIRQANDGAGVDVAVMAAGTQDALDLSVGSVRARGRVVVFSAIEGAATLNLFRLHTQELEVLGACNDQDFIDSALVRLADPALGLSSLITHRLHFDQWPRAFDLARNGKDEALKVALLFGNNE